MRNFPREDSDRVHAITKLSAWRNNEESQYKIVMHACSIASDSLPPHGL